jgi:hypothetical protein
MKQLNILSDQEIDELKELHGYPDNIPISDHQKTVHALLDTIKARDLIADATFKQLEDIGRELDRIIGI